MMRVLFLVALFACIVVAQPKAQLAGVVQDRSGAVVRDAAVTVVNMDTGIRRSVRSNAEGFYAVSSLSAGMYKLTVRKEGFRTIARVGMPLQATEAGRVDFLLDIGSMQEVITVQATTPMMNIDDATSGITMGSDPAQSLPLNGRGLQGLIELAPGVLATPANGGEAGQFSTNGQRPNTNYFTVDGVSANNGVSGSGLPGQFSGGALPSMTAIGSLHNLVTLGELQELRVQTSTFAPEFGRLPGAHIAVSTRSGSNEVHAELFGSVRNSGLTATDWFARRSGLGKRTHRLVDVGAVLGGPLRRDRTFGFVSFERLDLKQPITFETVVPSTGSRAGWLAAYPMPTGPAIGGGLARYTAQVESPGTVTTGSGRIDHALGGLGSFFARYSRTPSSSETGFLQRNRTSFTSQTVTAGVVTAALDGRVTNDARVSFSRTSVDSDWRAGAASPLPLSALLPPPSGSSGEQRLYGIAVNGLAPLVSGDPGHSRQTQWNFVDTVALPFGRHNLRFGIDYQRLTPVRERPISSVVAEYATIADVLAGVVPVYTFAQAGAGASLIETLSLFAQDTWRVTPRLNVTYGVRWEVTPPPSYRTAPLLAVISPSPLPPGATDAIGGSPAEPIWRTRYNQWAPRLGIAYRMADNLVLRTGVGLFYDLSFSSATDLLNGAPYNRWRNLLGPTIVVGRDMQYGFARDLRLPYSMEWNVTLERAIGADAAASAAYVGSAGRRLLRREASESAVLATNHGESSYHALQLQARSRSRRGIQGVVSYTWSHSIDNGSWDSGTFMVFPGLGASQDRGRSNFDARHNFQASLSYRLPKGWLASGIFRARTGFPIDVVARDNAFGLGFDNLRPDVVKNPWIMDANAPGGRRLDPKAFRVPGSGQGSLGRNALQGLGLAQLDLAAERQWVLTERAQLRFRVEAYNATNRASFADPARHMSNPLFGESTALAGLMLGAGRPNSGLSPAFQPGGPRTLQIEVSLRF
ncbi:MAG TPA: TonB-dependent receptor [Bryobacteraceae bacterium]|nr:TonB-dependent receptor [Bryobacteraceae bacterium]